MCKEGEGQYMSQSIGSVEGMQWKMKLDGLDPLLETFIYVRGAYELLF